MTYSKINVSNQNDEVSGFSFKLILLIVAIIATLGVNVMVFNANQSTHMEANKISSPFTTEMVILVK
ncbi:MAG: hypothetical protein AB8H03_28460 [Saprospiraceae bacterium]